MSDSLPNLDLPVLSPSQSQKHVTHNEALRILDAITQLAVLSDTLDTPPAAPDAGSRYLVPPGGQGAWSGQDGMIASFDQDVWLFYAPKPGWCMYVIDTSILKVFEGPGWRLLGGNLLENLTGFGLGMDASNAPFSAKLNAALWTALYAADGGTGDIRQTLNKETPANDAGLIFQTGFATRALLGLFGTNHPRLSVTQDGSNFLDGLVVNGDTGIVDQPQLPRFSGATNFDNFGPVNEWIKIGINDLSYNDQSVFDAGTSLFTAPVDGLYHFGGHLLFKVDANDRSRMNSRMMKNGTDLVPGTFGRVTSSHANGLTFLNTQAVTPLTAGDTIELQGQCSNFSGYFKADETSFWGYKVG